MLIPVLVEPMESHGYRATSAPGLALVVEGATPDEAFGNHGSDGTQSELTSVWRRLELL
jgi:hypothetical protein